jgi:uncharacterized protein (DUF4415 family)
MTSTNKKEIRYGKRRVLADADFRNPKIRISIMVDEDVIRVFKTRARETGEGYQTLMQRALRQAAQQPSLEERIAKLEEALKAS